MDNESQVIIMDDESDYANFIFDVVQSLNLNGVVTTSADEFMRIFNTNFTIVFLDLNIPGVDGVGLLTFVAKKHPKCNVILMSGVEDRILGSAEAYAQSIGLNVVGRFQKTIRLAELEALLKKCIALSKVEVSIPPQAKPNEFEVTKDELIRAINNDEFVIYYQPKVNISTRGFYGVEALVRWAHPEHKLIFPDQFINLAESFGLIDDISWLIHKKALQEIGELQNEIQFPFKLSLNLSPLSLKDIEFPNKFIQMVKQFSVSQENIILEVTETGLIKELSSALAIFTRLRLNKIQLSIDDFGTGYSMMQQLKIIPANEIKIDKSFVQDMLLDNSSRVTVNKVIEIGHELDMKVVAEGVETKEQLQYLQIHGCDIAQGYYFSKPISITDLKEWIGTKYGLLS